MIRKWSQQSLPLHPNTENPDDPAGGVIGFTQVACSHTPLIILLVKKKKMQRQNGLVVFMGCARAQTQAHTISRCVFAAAESVQPKKLKKDYQLHLYFVAKAPKVWRVCGCTGAILFV